MCLQFGVCIIKYILFIVNLILTIFGLGILALGIFALVKLQEIQILGIIIIVIGAVITIIFFLGCCGAISRNNCMLISYTVIIVILGTLTVVLTVFLSNHKAQVKEIFAEQFTEIFNGTESKESVSAIEYTFKCCGTTGPDSYANSTVPISCCPDVASNIDNIQTIITDGNGTNIGNGQNDIKFCSAADAYQDGCLEFLMNEVLHVLDIVINVLICICIGEYVAAAIAIALTCYNRRKKNHRSHY